MRPSSSRTSVPGPVGIRSGASRSADPPEDDGDQGVVFDEVVDHRGESGFGGAQRWQELTVFTGVMGMDRGAEAEAIAEQLLAVGVRGAAASPFGGLLAKLGEPLRKLW